MSSTGGSASTSDATHTLPLVTVFVACYNHARFVVQALDSVKQQNYPNVQLIVADDRSKDDSVSVIRAWLDRNWPDAQFIVHTENRGICRTFNEIIGHARGKYISGFAADDVWLPGRLHGHVAFMESQTENVGVLWGDAYQIDEHGRRLPQKFMESHRALTVMPEGDVFAALTAGNFIPAMTTLVRRRCFEEVGGYDESLAFEDWDMWLRIARNFHFRYWPEPSAEYRILSTSMMRTQSDAIRISGERILIKCLHRGWLTGGVRSVARGLDHNHTMEHYRRKSPERFRETWACFRRNPSPKNFLLLACCFAHVPPTWHASLLQLAQKSRRG